MRTEIQKIVRDEIKLNRDFYSAFVASPSEKSVNAVADMVFAKIIIRHGDFNKKTLEDVIKKEVQKLPLTSASKSKVESSSYIPAKDPEKVHDAYYTFVKGGVPVKKIPETKFTQGSLIAQLDSENPDHRTLVEFKDKYGGLCELICNRILISDLLDRNDESLLRSVTLESLNTEEIKKSHLLSTNSKSLFMALFFGRYPNNILDADQKNLINGEKKVDREILRNALGSVDNQETLKLEVFRKDFLRFKGHSLLIKKIENDKYTFFDSNFGEYRNLTFDQLCNAIDFYLKKGWTDILLMKGSDFLKTLRESRNGS